VYRSEIVYDPASSAISPDRVCTLCGPLLSTTSRLLMISCEPSSEVVAKLYDPDRPTVRNPVHRTLNRSGGVPFHRRRNPAVDGALSTATNAG
jgi:hypothetical protein